MHCPRPFTEYRRNEPRRPETYVGMDPTFKAEALRHHRDGHNADALQVIQRALHTVRASHGRRSPEDITCGNQCVRMCNSLALECMRFGVSGFSSEAAHMYLKWASTVPHLSLALQASTLNNLSIYYARSGQPKAALRCLKQVSGQAGAAKAAHIVVHTSLNMSTVLADLGRHEEALEAAQEAIRVMTKSIESHEAPAGSFGFTKRQAPSPTDASLLSAAYHNLAVQQEKLGATQVHVHSYRTAALQARRNGAAPSVVDFMRREYASARQRSASGTSLLYSSSSGGGSGTPCGWRPVGGPATSTPAHSISQPVLGGGQRPSSAQSASRRVGGIPAGGRAVRPASAQLRGSASQPTMCQSWRPAEQSRPHGGQAPQAGRGGRAVRGAPPPAAKADPPGSGLITVMDLFDGHAGARAPSMSCGGGVVGVRSGCGHSSPVHPCLYSRTTQRADGSYRARGAGAAISALPHALRTPIKVPAAMRPNSASSRREQLQRQNRAPSPTEGARRSPRSQAGLHPLLSPLSANLNAPPVAYEITPGPTDPRGPTCASTARREQTAAHKVVQVRLQPGAGTKVLQVSVVAIEAA